MEITSIEKRHLSSMQAAKKTRLTNDHISRLCREGKVTCSFIGNSWYIEEDSLDRYLHQVKEFSQQRKSELVRQRRREYLRHLEIRGNVVRTSAASRIRLGSRGLVSHGLVPLVGTGEIVLVALVLYLAVSFGGSFTEIRKSIYALSSVAAVASSVFLPSVDVTLFRVEKALFIK